MPTLMQKIRLALRGWSRRREEKLQQFLEKESGRPGRSDRPSRPVASVDAGGEGQPSGRLVSSIDMDGLHAAYLDGSGQIAYYLDVETGEVVEHRDATVPEAMRYKRVPAGGGDIAERRAFIETLEPSPARTLLMKSVNTAAFRTALANDRATERAWYNFRNDRAIEAIDAWLTGLGLR
jgi:hypothetical protein